jgi:hypothetical protein
MSRRPMMRSRSRSVITAAASLPCTRGELRPAFHAQPRSGARRATGDHQRTESRHSRSRRGPSGNPPRQGVVRRRTRDRRAGARAHCRARAAYVAARHRRIRVSCATAFVERRAAVLSPSRRVAGHAFSHTGAGALAGICRGGNARIARGTRVPAVPGRQGRKWRPRCEARPAGWGALSRSRACVRCRRGWPCRTRPARRRRRR